MLKRRVVITGVGVISAAGNNTTDFWNSLIAGKSGIKHIDRFDVSAFSTRIAAQVEKFNVEDYIPRREARRMDLFVQYACAAACQAVEDAGYSISPDETYRVGVWVGSGIGGLETMEKQHQALLKKGPSAINPFLIPMMIPNMATGQISIMFGAKGPSGCTVTACASGADSIGQAVNLIRCDKADVMITGGTEASITTIGIGGFCAAKAMSTDNDHPQEACRPFDLTRGGFVMGEGSGILIVEELEHARQRGAKIYAEIIGYGSSADAYHVVQPDEEGNGAAQAFKAVLNDADLKPEDINYINAHGTGTQLNDAIETKAIKRVFGDYAYRLAISSIKPATGHMLGAAGAVELIATALAIKNKMIPMTINLTNPDPVCDLDYVPGSSRYADINIALSDSLGFGGHNAVLAVKKY